MYAKLFTSIYMGTLRGNSHGLLVFTNLLAHADSAGLVDIHPKAIADEVGLSEADVRKTLEMLESPDDESRSPEEQGRRIVRIDEHRAWGWRVVNYLKYRAIRNEEDRREQNRLAQERWRNKNKTSVSQDKPSVSDGETDKPIQKQKHKQKKENTTQPPNGGRTRKVSLASIRAWAEATRAKGEKLIPDNDPVFAYAEQAGIPAEYLDLAWLAFRRRYAVQYPDKRYADWRRVFRNCVEGNWLKLWYADKDGRYRLTTVGIQASQATQEAA